MTLQKLEDKKAEARNNSMEIKTAKEFTKQLEGGAHAWPGGYPLYFITNDGAALSFDAAKENHELIAESIADDCNDGWQVIGCDVNWEDSELVCDHSGEKIESAYGELEERRTTLFGFDETTGCYL